MSRQERATFNLLWDMVKEVLKADGRGQGTIISRHASLIDDRLNNSGHSRSVDSLKLYTTEQLEEELEERNASI